MKKPVKLTKAQQERRKAEDARLDRLLDNISLTTLVRSARLILQGMKSMKDVAVQPTAHERRCAQLESMSSSGNGPSVIEAVNDNVIR